ISYSGGISSPNTAFDAGSRLSCHLAWGTISLRCVFHELTRRGKQLAGQQDPASIRWRKSLRAFQSRLHWRDHFMQRLESAPSMEFTSINPAYNQIQYQQDPHLLECWITGQTGLPIVDACMRCLAATGFMNFRMRAMLISVGCFGLAQSWQSLQYPLARLFLDYEPGIHFSQIQMQAGIVGINTLRVYSPLKQLNDQDPQARFVKQWIPELRRFDAIQIAQYEEQPLGDYQRPVADFKANTRLIRDQVYAIRKSDAGKVAAEQVLKEHGSRLSGNDRNKRKAAGVKKSVRKPAPSAKNRQLTLDLGE
ncbi:MAG: FAD-binding domain-containing protein, partial [Granulosicoccus sp.]